MNSTASAQAKFIIGPYGTPLSIADLPPPDTQRWVIRRKAEIVAAVRAGLLSLDDIGNRYGLTIEELMAWQSSIDRHGLRGLRITCYQHYQRRAASGVA